MPPTRRPTAWLIATFALLAGLSAVQPAFAGGGEAKKASFDAIPSSESPILQFRSVSIGVAPAHSLELDFYLASKWAFGASIYGTSNSCLDRDGPCHWTTGLGAHVERFFGNRIGHIGVRAGIFATTYYVQNRSIYDGTPVARNGGLFGPKVGLTATFTPLRWAGIHVTATAMPGFFEGFKTHEWVNNTFEVDEDSATPTREFVMTGMLTVGVRFGTLDGPDPICRCCRDASIPCSE
jgi:hypothetical protein